MRIGILTVSDRAAAGEMEDLGGPAVEGALQGEEFDVVAREIVPDERVQIERQLRQWADADRLDVVFTTGGTGLGPRDVTPEATLSVADRQVPGIAEAIRAASTRVTDRAMLSRGVAAMRGETLIVNLPGSPGGARDGVAVVLPVLAHAVATMRGAKH
jgi:molybdopterin adenylyltransferase